MALTQLTKVDGGGISTTSDYRVGIITASKFVGPFDGTGGNFSGVVTATNGVFSGNISAVDGNFSGNVSIGGTLTYEDVTNIDSVGIITAQKDVHVTSSSRGGSARIGITWSSRHAGPGGYGEYSFAWTDEHHTSRAQVLLRKQHFLSYGNASHSPYNWTSNPAVTVYESDGTTNSAGFYLRVQGRLDANSSTYEGGILHHFDIVHNDNNTGQFKTYFEFVSNSTPSDAGSALAFN